MAETWGNPENKVVVAFQPVMKDGVQVTDKGVAGGLKWNVRYEGTAPAWSIFIGEPVVGEQVQMRLLTSVGQDGKEWKTWFSEDAYKLKIAAPAGGRGQGAARDYTIENRQRAVDAAIAFKGDKDWDLFTTLSCADQLVEYYKLGNKPPRKTA